MHSQFPVPGDDVWIRQQRWRVERSRRSGHLLRLDVASRDRRLTFLAPFDRARRVGGVSRLRYARPQEAAARLAHIIATAEGHRTPQSAVAADATIFPHQLEPALAMLSGVRRLLIADEVGLGKTIQAALIVAETMRRDSAARVLILVPAGLQEQWASELARRFRLSCAYADRHGLDAAARTRAAGDNPWRRAGVWLTSPDFVKQRHVLDALPPEPWDLVVVDEAHTNTGASERFEACAEIARRARCCVLLTATPHAGDAERFARLLDLGKLDTRPDDLRIFRRTRAGLGLPVNRRVRWHRVNLSHPERQTLAALAAFERAVLRSVAAAGRDQGLLLLSVFRKRALSTMAALVISLDRRLAWLGATDEGLAFDWVQPRLGFEDDADDAGEWEQSGLMAATGLPAHQERSWLKRVRQLAVSASRVEAKLTRAAAIIDRANEPVVVFTEFRDSLMALTGRLGQRHEVAMLHGGQSPLERRQQLDRFLHGPATVLAATDVASQGLNLQTRARWVMSLELPWNPARLEQRIGRVDRISQTRPVHFTLLVARDDSETGVLTRLARRVLSARREFSDDLLTSVAPDEPAVRRALLDAGSEDWQPASRVVEICRGWVRHARFLARQLDRRRALSACWRTPTSASVRFTRWTRVDRLRGVHRSAAGALFVLAVPILDGAGALLERHIVIVRGGSVGRADFQAPELRRAIDDAALRRTAPRVTRLAGICRAHQGLASDIERALADSIAWPGPPPEVQIGLFDQREQRTLTALQELDEEAAARTHARLSALEVAAQVQPALRTSNWRSWRNDERTSRRRRSPAAGPVPGDGAGQSAR